MFSKYRRLLPASLGAAALLGSSTVALAEDGAAINALDTVWVLICAFLVFFMHAGFSLLEAGLARRKNVVNILSKNLLTVAMSAIIFYAFGFALMFGNGNPFIGITGWFVPDDASIFSSLDWANIPVSVKFFFQMVFAATGATIVSGAVAERIHYVSFLIFAAILVGIMYPIEGHWIWGGGWLADRGFADFAGSTVVHSAGGWAALAGIMVLGPRMGKFGPKGEIRPIPGHSMALVSLGTLILWLGWFGFNPGSTMAANPAAIGHVTLTTALGGAAGAVVATFYTWGRMGKPDFGLSCNGALAGLVGITAGCAHVNGEFALLIGAIAGVLVVEAVVFFDRLKLDDPVGATSVHLVCGIWGTLAVGLFADGTISEEIAGVESGVDGLIYGGGVELLTTQLIGVLAIAAFVFPLSFAVWMILKKTIGIRVTPETENQGLDIIEMGMEAYPSDGPRTLVNIDDSEA